MVGVGGECMCVWVIGRAMVGGGDLKRSKSLLAYHYYVRMSTSFSFLTKMVDYL